MKTPTHIEVSTLDAYGVVIDSTPLVPITRPFAAVRTGVVYAVDDTGGASAEYSYKLASDYPGLVPPVLTPPVDPPPVVVTPTPTGTTNYPTPTPKPGDTILEDGSYSSKTFSGRTFARNPGKVIVKGGAKFAAGAVVVGVIFDGGGADSQDNTQAAVYIDQKGVKLYDCTVCNAAGVGVGLKSCDAWLVRVIAEHNGRAGIGGTSVQDAKLIDCTSRGNNDKLDPNGGGGKFTRTKSIRVEGHEAYDNYAAGMWYDYNNINVWVGPSATRPSRFYNNKDGYKGGSLKAGGSGFFGEISGIVDGSSTAGPIVLQDVIAFGNRKGISAGELKASTNEDVNFRSCSNFKILGGKIDRIVVSGGEGRRTEAADKGGNNVIDGVTCKAPVLSDRRFGDLVGKGLVKITNIKIVK